MTITAATAARTQCPNCDAPLLSLQPPPAHCPRCGQATRLHAPTFFEFIHEFIGHYVALEGALWRTLGNLFFRPGRLTTEYIAGRRRRYVLPLRLYITASFLFFVIVKVFGGSDEPVLRVQVAAPEEAASAAGDVLQSTELSACLLQPQNCNAIERAAAQFINDAGQPGALQKRVGPNLDKQMLALAPYAALAMQPVFAGLMQLAYRNRRKAYGEHFLFSLHMHAFWFLALLMLTALPDTLDDYVLPLFVPHGLLALQQVYRGRWWATTLRWLVVSASYGVLLSLTSLALIVAIALF